MRDYRSLYQSKVWAVPYGPKQARLTPYEILMNRSRLLGRTAAKTYDITKHFLHRDQLSPEQSPRSERKFFERYPDHIHEVVEQSRDVLAGAKTVILPSNLFPDTVTVDRMKVTITQRTFFWSADVVSLRIEDILNVSTSLGPFFGSLTISTRVMNSTDHFVIDGFWRRDAIRLKHIIQGYMIALHQGIDTSQLTTERLIRKLNELGNDPTVVK